MATFDSSSFDERGGGGGGGFQVHGAQAQDVVFVIPGGNPVRQSVGVTFADVTISAQGTGSQFTALRGKVNATASLVYVGGTVTAYLRKVSDATQVRDGIDLWRWQMEFSV